ncbi:MAG: MATE family efflux transporter [Kangiellaceae bacterium]|nr:MATE family efflux transporter [Kangiellaceae bacterium]
MTASNRIKVILNLALPITVALGSTFIMNLVDLAMVGTLGNNAVAALGLSGFANTLIVTFVIGIAPAVQGIVARRTGEMSKEPKCLPLNGGLLVVLAIGIPLTVLCFFVSPLAFPLMSSDPEVIQEGIPYLRALFSAIIAVGVNAAFQGFWTGIGRVKVFMLIILVMNCINIFLNYVLIFGNFGAPKLGAMGAGVATATATYVGNLIYLVVTYIYFSKQGFLNVKPKLELMIRIFKIGLPDSISEALFSLGYVVFLWMVGLIGTAALAAASVLVRFSMVLTLFAKALGLTSSTLVSQTLGSGDADGANQWGWDSVKVGVVCITLLGVPMLIFPEWFLSLVLVDAYTISIAIVPLQIVALTSGLISLVFLFVFTLVSLGDGKRVMIVSFCTQWLLFLPVIWIVVHYFEFGLLEVWLIQAIYGLLTAALMTALWIDGRWKTIKL